MTKVFSSGSVLKKIPVLLVFFLMLLAIAAGIKEFRAWYQVQKLWFSSEPLLSFWAHLHFSRTLVVSPGLWLEDRMPSYGFSYYCTVFWFLNSCLWLSINRKIKTTKPSFLAWILFMMVHVFMNGRGVIVWTSWLVCISLCLDFSRAYEPVKWVKSRILVALLLATVTTGVFIVVFCSLVFFLIKNKIDLRKLCSMGGLVLLMPMVYLSISYFLRAMEKNLDFYGGGLSAVFDMLQHGAGKFLFFENKNYYLLIAVLILVVGGMLALWIKRTLPPSMRCLLLISLLGGMFGFSVATLAIPIFLCTIPRFRLHSPRVNGMPVFQKCADLTDYFHEKSL